MGNSLKDATDHLADQASPGYTTVSDNGTKTLVKSDNPDFVAGRKSSDYLDKNYPGMADKFGADDATLAAIARQVDSDRKRRNK